MSKDITVIVSKLYPKLKSNMTPATLNKYKKLMGIFMERRAASFYDIAPCDRIFYSTEDAQEFFECFGVSEDTIKDILPGLYYWPMANFNPVAAKDPLTLLALCVLRYFYLTKGYEKELELSMIYLAFSGKFYPSIHSGSYPKFTPAEHRHVMEFVVNNKLTEKFDIRKYGSIVNAIKSICKTWLDTYEDRFRSFDDEDIVYLIQQLHTRIKSFTINIASVYYDVYANKDEYIAYSSDSISEDEYRLSDNNSLKIERYAEKSMNAIVASGVDYRLCKTSSSALIKTDELKSIIETIIEDKSNIPIIKELITLLLAQYFIESEDKDPTNVRFIATSVAVKPNSKDPNVNRIKEIIENWLDETSPAYRKRKSRAATKSAYHRALLTYFVLVIHYSAKS